MRRLRRLVRSSQKPECSTSVGSLIGHRIKAVPVNESQPVEANEILIEIDDELIAAEKDLALAQKLDAEGAAGRAQVALAEEQVLLAELALKELVQASSSARDGNSTGTVCCAGEQGKAGATRSKPTTDAKQPFRTARLDATSRTSRSCCWN